MNKKSHHQKGISTLEVMIALVVLSLGIMPTIMMIRNVNKGLDDRELELKAITMGQNLLEHIRSKKWDETAPNNYSYVESPSSIGPDGESLVSDYDDIDDFDGYTDKPTELVTRQVNVDYVNVNLNSDVSTAGSPTDFKKVKITVSWVQGGNHSRTIETILSNVY